MTEPGRTLFRGGRVIDGAGGPPFVADILVEAGRFVAIGDLGALPDADIVDARGLAIAPGFIDVHQHADFCLLAFPGAESAVMQGVTTVVNGNCGGGVAPALPEFDVRRVAFGYSDAWGVEITWRSFGEYLARLTGIAVNAATLVPHGAVERSSGRGTFCR